MFPASARRYAGTLAIAGTALALGATAPPAPAVTPTFESTVHAAPGRPYSVAIGDLTGDARADVLANSDNIHAISLWRNTGGASLAAAQPFSVAPAQWPGQIGIGDVDGDGDGDAVVLNDGGVVVMRNDGTGGFSVAQQVAVHRGANGVTVGDVNGDGRADVAVGHGYVLGDIAEGGVKVYLGQADGDPLGAAHWQEQFVGRTSTIRFQDVDEDGHRDLVYGALIRDGATTSAASTDGVVIQLGDGTGSFGAQRVLDAGDREGTKQPFAFDATGDGIKDVIAAQSSNELSLWRGLGDGAYAAPTASYLENFVGDASLADFNSDGRKDLVVTYGGNYKAVILLDFADGRTQGGTIALRTPNQHVYGVTTGDIDGDGRTDAVVASYSETLLGSHSISVFRNTTEQPKACADGRDNDGDGKADLNDPGCSGSADDDETDPPPPPPPAMQCEDGEDNDGDGNVDLADAGCSTATDDDESDDPAPPPPPPPSIPFAGFFAPVDNLPTLNVATGGRAIPVKFSLEGDRGLGIFAEGYPRSQEIPCDGSLEVDGIEETVTAGDSTLTYDATADRYQYVWKTSESWSGTCRQLVLKLLDGSAHRASFRFR